MRLKTQRDTMKRDVDKIQEQEALTKKAVQFRARAAQLKLQAAEVRAPNCRCV